MPILAGLIANLFGGVLAQIVAMFVKKAGTAVAASAAIAVCMATLVVAFNTVVTPFVSSMFNTQYGQFIGLAFPPIAGTCLAAIGTTWAACGLYKLKVATIKATASS